jgi:DNA-binding HxlR family transcriptional regulator
LGKLKILEQTSALQILQFLLSGQPATRTDLKENIDSSQQAIYNAISVLRKANLVTEKAEDKFPFRVTISLTDKGQKIAQYLVEIDKSLY